MKPKNSNTFKGFLRKAVAFYKNRWSCLVSRTTKRFLSFCIHFLFNSGTAQQQIEENQPETISTLPAEELIAVH